MQTTLRIEDELFRQAKAQAAAQGISLTRLVEEAIREHLAKPAAVPRAADAFACLSPPRLVAWLQAFRISRKRSPPQRHRRKRAGKMPALPGKKVTRCRSASG